MDVGVAATAFAVVLPVELPDKTFIATLVLSTRYRGLPVWVGVAAAFAVQCFVAVAAGTLLALLPRTVVLGGAALLFAVGAVVLLRGVSEADAHEAEEEREIADRIRPAATPLRAAAASFMVLFVAEWGDLSQLFTAGLAARTGDAVSVFAGSWLALAVVAGTAVLLGRALLARVRLALIRRTTAVVCAVLAVLTAVEAYRAR
ncbi:MAG: TMEM165/GDT1 family protein [Actinomycetota bacterium]|nr:TMEM165/GDT1 family protein [Actinomycetota bacterium]